MGVGLELEPEQSSYVPAPLSSPTQPWQDLAAREDPAPPVRGRSWPPAGGGPRLCHVADPSPFATWLRQAPAPRLLEQALPPITWWVPAAGPPHHEAPTRSSRLLCHSPSSRMVSDAAQLCKQGGWRRIFCAQLHRHAPCRELWVGEHWTDVWKFTRSTV